MSMQASRRYAELSGDSNPLHLDEEYGARSEFGSVVAHGNLCLQLCFDCFADALDLPALPVGAQLRIRFLRAVLLGDDVTFAVTAATERSGILFVEGECSARGETVAAVAAQVPWTRAAVD